MQKLPRDFYARETALVARELLGKTLVHIVAGVPRLGKIVETEAYLGPHDHAAHSHRGLTPRTRIMFGPPGHAYVYFIYGMHFCLNIVTEPEGHGAAVLLRGLEPIQNITDRTDGPGRLCRALAINRHHNGVDLLGDTLYLTHSATPPELFTTVKRPRIGVDYAGSWAKRLLRFYVKGNRFVSKP